jgi:hypothetical protein
MRIDAGPISTSVHLQPHAGANTLLRNAPSQDAALAINAVSLPWVSGDEPSAAPACLGAWGVFLGQESLGMDPPNPCPLSTRSASTGVFLA